MRFLAAVWLAASIAAGAVNPSTVTEPEVAPVSGALKDVTGVVTDIHDSVKKFSTDPKPVVKAASDASKAIQAAESAVGTQSAMDVFDALELKVIANELEVKVNALFDDLKAKKDLIEKGELCGVVLSITLDITAHVKALIEAAIAKLPERSRESARTSISGLLRVLVQIQIEFSEDKCSCKCKQSSSALGLPGTITTTQVPGNLFDSCKCPSTNIL